MSPELAELELVVLLAVAALRDEAYGLAVRREVEKVRRREYSVGAVYTTLKRLEEKRFVESWMTEPLPVRGGRARRQFRVSAAGRKAMTEARRQSSRAWATMGFGLKPL